jgi:hypothetical protein
MKAHTSRPRHRSWCCLPGSTSSDSLPCHGRRHANGRAETIAGALELGLRRRERVAGGDAIRHLDEVLLTQRLIELYRSVISRNAGAGIRAVPRPE